MSENLIKLTALPSGTPDIDYPRPERLLVGKPKRETWNRVQALVDKGTGVWPSQSPAMAPPSAGAISQRRASLASSRDVVMACSLLRAIVPAGAPVGWPQRPPHGFNRGTKRGPGCEPLG